jgi:uncharacterized protein (TIGR03437 family)
MRIVKSMAAGVLFVALAAAQVSGNQSLTGKYYFRHVLLVTDGTTNVSDTRSASGTLTFDGNGNFTISAQQLVGTTAAASITGNGTYTVKPGGFVTMTNPQRAGATVNARLGSTALVGSSTEAGATVFDLLVAIPAATATLSNATLSGGYTISSLEFPNGGLANIRNTNFKLTANGSGGFNESTVTGQAANLSNKLQNQTVGPNTYSVSGDATGTVSFPIASGSDATKQLIAGTKNIFVAQDGSFFIGGSTTAGIHGIVVGVKAFASGGSNSSWSGFFWAAGLRFDTLPARLSGVSGAVNAVGNGSSVWARRTRQSDGLLDAAPLITYSLGADGSGAFVSTAGHVNVASTGQSFASSGVDIFDSSSYELYFGTKFVPQSGTGVFLNPQGILNSASFAPPGYPLSPGGLMTLFGSGFGTQNGTAVGGQTFPTTLANVQVTVNNIPAPLYSVSSNPAQISGVVPFGVTGSTATVVVTVGTTKSNAVDVPLAPTAPGIFSINQNGLGDGAVLHANFSAVTAANPARRGETVLVFLTGLGAVTPSIADGAVAPVSPLRTTTGPLNVFVGGQLVTNVSFSGLAPTLAGLYQLNIAIPNGAPTGSVNLAIQTVEGFTDLVNIFVQ